MDRLRVSRLLFEQRRRQCARAEQFIFYYACFQPLTDKAKYTLIANTVFNKPHHPTLIDVVKEPFDVGVQYPVHRLGFDPDRQGVQRIVLSPAGVPRQSRW